MKILFLGDIVGRKAVDVVCNKLPSIRENLNLDFVIVNAENSYDGFGITPDICNQLFSSGVDVITPGDHIWNQKSIIPYIKNEPRLLRPMNLLNKNHGLSYNKYFLKNGLSIVVVGIMGKVFIDNGTTKQVSSPFSAIDEVLLKYSLPVKGMSDSAKDIVNAIFIDIHAEATSEKMAFAHFIDGRVSAVIGTHTHVPTADTCILSGGTAYQSDAGMCGDYDSSIGMTVKSSLNLFTDRNPNIRLTVADGEVSLCGVIIEINDATGLSISIDNFILSNRLKSTYSI